MLDLPMPSPRTDAPRPAACHPQRSQLRDPPVVDLDLLRLAPDRITACVTLVEIERERRRGQRSSRGCREQPTRGRSTRQSSSSSSYPIPVSSPPPETASLWLHRASGNTRRAGSRFRDRTLEAFRRLWTRLGAGHEHRIDRTVVALRIQNTIANDRFLVRRTAVVAIERARMLRVAEAIAEALKLRRRV